MRQPIDCKTLLVKFKDRNLCAQEISITHIPGAHKIRVRGDNGFLILDFETDEDKLVKQINFSLSEIREYVCDSILWDDPAPVPTNPDLPFSKCYITWCPKESPCPEHSQRWTCK